MFSPVYNEQFFVACGPIDPEGASSGRKPRCSKAPGVGVTGRSKMGVWTSVEDVHHWIGFWGKTSPETVVFTMKYEQNTMKNGKTPLP